MCNRDGTRTSDRLVLKERQICCNYDFAFFTYRELFGDSFFSPIFFLQLSLTVALDRRPARQRVPPLNHLSSTYTLTNHKDAYISHAISMHRPGNPRKTAVSDLTKVILSGDAEVRTQYFGSRCQKT